MSERSERTDVTVHATTGVNRRTLRGSSIGLRGLMAALELGLSVKPDPFAQRAAVQFSEASAHVDRLPEPKRSHFVILFRDGADFGPVSL